MSLTGEAYGLGVGLGLASYHASVGDSNFAQQDLDDAFPLAVAISQHRVPLDVAQLSTILSQGVNYNAIVALRGLYAGTLESIGLPGTAYNFGVAVAIAEGEASSLNEAARWIVNDSLQNARTAAFTLAQNGVNVNLQELNALIAASLHQPLDSLHNDITFFRNEQQAILDAVQP